MLTEEKVHLSANTPQREADVWAPGLRPIEESILHLAPTHQWPELIFLVEFLQAFKAAADGEMSLSGRDVSQERSGEKPFPKLSPKAKNIPRETE